MTNNDTAPMDYIEMLSTDDSGRAKEGVKYPRDLGVAKWVSPDSEEQRLAYPCKFFRRDDHGQPMPETLVEFLVPDYLMDGPNPSRRALLLVEERMGWTAPSGEKGQP